MGLCNVVLGRAVWKHSRENTNCFFFLALSSSICWQFSWKQTRSRNGSHNLPATARDGKNNGILKGVTNPGAPLLSHCTTSWLYKCIQEDQNPLKVWNGSFFQPWRGNFNLKLPFSRLPSVGQHNQQNPNLRALVPLVTQSFGDLQSENHSKTSDRTLLFCLQLHLCTSLSLSFN